MGDYEDLLERLREQEVDEDLVAGLEKFNAGALRKKAGERDEFASKVEDLEKQLKRVEQAPKVEKAFRDAGVDFEQLRPAERITLQNLEFEGDPDPDIVAKTISEYALPLIDGTQQQGQQDPPPAAAAIAAQARSAGAPTRTAGIITPEMVGGQPDPENPGAFVGGWSTEAAMRFHKEHPVESEALRRGETVQVQFTP
jgi:hypothetical protein